jgi:MerR family copper efflux transcriptional regulator
MIKKSLDHGIGSRVENENGNKSAAMRRFYRAGELARVAGVSTDALRYYERQRLLAAPPRAANGYRHYPLVALSRVRVIRSALAVGFSVDELTKILGARDRGLAPCQQVRQLAANKLKALQERIQELQHLRRALSTTLAGWDRQLAKTPSGGKAGLLYSLANEHPSAARQLSPLLAPALRRKLSRRGEERASRTEVVT